jgi:hypothetical protein
MKKGIIIVLFTVCITTLYANEMTIAKQFKDANG